MSKINTSRFLVVITLMFVFSACSKNIETLSVIRFPSLTAKLGNNTINGTNFKLSGPVDEIAYLSDTAKSGKKVFRYNFQSDFKSSTGQNFQLIITFDTSNPSDFRGVYTQNYTSKGGLFSVVLIKQTSNDSFSKYVLKGKTENTLEINRIGTTEKIFAGNFQFSLKNQRDSTEILSFSNGKFDDIQF